ncbi:JmjC domain-containing protein 7 [Physocladia obscura]|uniref:JmjC domain-containing protein 7 n=1 Tax=Physocladia obscura TaxID=109957 RepID=A0AAD5XB32_9FUNG|nr:JmjC domain-containing protein 7 [Physocladia obscura]
MFGMQTIAEFDDADPTAAQFAQLVCENRPAVFRRLPHHKIPTAAERETVLAAVGDLAEVKVAVTPNGFADAIVDGVFCLPLESKMPLSEFYDLIDRENSDESPQSVHYIQSQNNNMRDGGDFINLFEHIPPDVPFATAALGAQPDAVNFWCGTRHATTSFHKDHYENLYKVLAGSKTFHLISPSESWALEERSWETSQYVRRGAFGDSNEWGAAPVYIDPQTFETHVAETRTDEFELCKRGYTRMTTRWASLDPSQTTRNSDHVSIFNSRVGAASGSLSTVLTVTLMAGDMLYLPALWSHKVEQGRGITVAINYWYDMKFGTPVFLMHQLLRGIAADAGFMERDEEIGDADEEF